MPDHETIRAYAVPERAAAYDALMDLMHPNRHPMAEVVCDILDAEDAEGDGPRTFLDLGTGTGFLLARLLMRFPRARAMAVDGAPAMLDIARERLASHAGRVEFHAIDFREIADGPLARTAFGGAVDAVVSCFALHHLSQGEKLSVVRAARELLAEGGWFLNADIVVSETPELERLIQNMRVRGIVKRAAGKDDRLLDEARTRRYLDELEENDHDQPLELSDDLEVLRRVGLKEVALFWRHTREVVIGGRK